MVVSTPQRRTTRHRGRRLAFRLDLEALETRALPSATAWPGLFNPVAETEPNDTLDHSQNLGDLTTAPRAEVIGTISNGPAGAGVDWYSFQLDRAANVGLTTPKASSASQPVTTLSLYNTDLYDANDPYNVLGYRLLEQADSAAQSGTAQIDRRLAPGTYYIAVSGSGNHYFNPFLAGSGYAGATGDYGLVITAADLGLDSSDGPAVLAADPQPGASLDRSPFLIRVDVSEPLDPGTVSSGSPGSSVQLISNANGTFGDGTDQVVDLASASLNTDGTELLIAPAAPLGPGFYKVVLAGDTSANPPQVLADLSGLSLGTSSRHPSGADFSYTFEINGNEGSSPAAGTTCHTADDTPATSHQLGDLTQAGFVQIAGAIGTDSTDPIPFNGSDVDLYHFTVSGSGRYAFTAEVFAGRIGSPLSPGVSLFQSDATTGQLTLVSSNPGTRNAVIATNGTLPLYADPALYAGLTSGDYYLAVSNNLNVAATAGPNGVFNPSVSHSGQNGGSSGDYVLNLQAQPGLNPPQVVAVTPNEGTTLNAPPTFLTVQFSEAVNLRQLAQTPTLDALGNPIQGTIAAVYVQGSDGTKYYPRFTSFDAATNQATFVMLNGLANDTYELHVSAALGLADLAGNALVGNDPSGDYVVHFTVNGPARGTGTNPLLWSDTEPNDDPAHPQDLGVLYTHDLQTGITLQRNFTTNAPADTVDYYQFQILEQTSYTFNFPSSSFPAGVQATLFDASGTPVPVSRQPNTIGFSTFQLLAGTYILKIGNWTTSQASGVNYTAVIYLGGNPDNPVALTAGPAPAIGIQLVTNAPPSLPATPLVVTPPPAPLPSVVSTPVSPPSLPSNPPAPPSNSTPPTGPANNPSAPPVVLPGSTNAPPTAVVTATPPATPTATLVTNVAANSPVPAPAASSPNAGEQPATASAVPPAVSMPASGSATVLVNLVAPAAGANNAGIMPALLRTLSDRPAETVSLPSGVLFALSAAPVGGIKESTLVDTPPPADHVLVRLPELPSSRPIPKTDSVDIAASRRVDLPGQIVAKTFQRSPAASASASESQRSKLSTLLSQGIRQLMNSSYTSALDALFGMAQWLEETALQAPRSSSFSEELPAQEESADFEGRGSALLPETTQVPNASDQVLVNGLAALAILAVARPENKKQRAEIKGRGLAVRNQK